MAASLASEAALLPLAPFGRSADSQYLGQSRFSCAPLRPGLPGQTHLAVRCRAAAALQTAAGKKGKETEGSSSSNGGLAAPGGTFTIFGGSRKAEQRLLDAVSQVTGRGRGASKDLLKEVEEAVRELESLKGVSNPVNSRLIEGSWKLLFTTRPGTASPIQRTFVGVDAFTVFQTIQLGSAGEEPRVSNIVSFGSQIGQLKVEAAASAASGQRINFQFDRAAFELKFWPYRFPYPVPFRLLGDEAKGWLDTTYLSPSGQLRISRGNKGTTFVLQKYFSPQDVLLQAIARGQGVQKAIEDVVALNPTRSPAKSPISSGIWKLLWTSQAKTASKIESFSTSLFKNYQVVDGSSGRLETIVEFFPGLVLRAGASTEAASGSVTDIEIDSASISIGPLTIPVGIRGTGNVDILYVDEKLRISVGNKGSIYVQQRETDPPAWL